MWRMTLSVALTMAMGTGTVWGQRFLCEPVVVGPGGSLGVRDYQVDEGASTGSVTIDVMLLYSPKAIENGTHGLLKRVIDDTNEIFQGSGTGITLRHVGTYVMNEDSEAAEAARRVEASTLETWSELSSELLREVRDDRGVDRVRQDVGADLVVAWTAHFVELTSAGRAYLPTTRDRFVRERGFAVIHSNGSEEERPEETFAHEVGHNLGLHHHPEAPDRTTADARSPYLAYGQGYLATNASLEYPYMTIMATSAGADEPRYSVDRFSRNGFYVWRGHNLRIGDQRHRAAEAAAATASWVAAYEDAEGDPDPEPEPEEKEPAAPSNLVATVLGPTSVRLDWFDNSDNESGFEVHFRHENGEWGQLAKNKPANTTSTLLVWETPPSVKRWHFRVRAVNEAGGANSNTVTVTLPSSAAGCPADRACIAGGEFEVRVWFWNESQWNRAERLTTADLGEYGAVFYFFGEDNPELLIKVIDACRISGHWWVFGSAATDLTYFVRVTPREGESVEYRRGATNPLIADASAIRCR